MSFYIVAKTVGAPIEPPIPSSWPIGPSNEEMIRRIDEHPESPNEEYAHAAHELLRPYSATLKHILVNVSPAGKMVPPSDTFDLIRTGVANAAGVRLSTEEATCEEATCEENQEVEDEEAEDEDEDGEDEPKGDEGYDDDGKANASTQVKEHSLAPWPEVAPAAVVSFDPPQSFPPSSGFADRRPEQSRPAPINTELCVQEARPVGAPDQAPGPAPFGLGISYPPQLVSQSITPGQNDSAWSEVRAGWSAASPIVLSPTTPAASSIPVLYTPEQFVLSRDASNRVVIDQVDPEAEKRRTRSLRAQALNYRMEDGMRVQATPPPLRDQVGGVPEMPPPGEQAWNGRTWHVPVTACKRSCCDTSRFFPRKYQRV